VQEGTKRDVRQSPVSQDREVHETTSRSSSITRGKKNNGSRVSVRRPPLRSRPRFRRKAGKKGSQKFRGNEERTRATIFLSVVFAKEQLAKGRRATPGEMDGWCEGEDEMDVFILICRHPDHGPDHGPLIGLGEISLSELTEGEATALLL
jgi:hypothetical protein